jgi:ribosomal protein S27AE
MAEVMLYCLVCPMCGQPPVMAISVEQAVCGNEDCSAITWNMTKTLDENIMNANAVRLPDWLSGKARDE